MEIFGIGICADGGSQLVFCTEGTFFFDNGFDSPTKGNVFLGKDNSGNLIENKKWITELEAHMAEHLKNLKKS